MEEQKDGARTPIITLGMAPGSRRSHSQPLNLGFVHAECVDLVADELFVEVAEAALELGVDVVVPLFEPDKIRCRSFCTLALRESRVLNYLPRL